MADTAQQRKNMVESQVRPSDVTDRRVTAAMTAIPREQFVPLDLASVAYSDDSLVIGSSAVMLAPRVLAKLVQLADVQAADKVLVIGGAPGYAAALLAKLAGEVTALLPASGDDAALARSFEDAGAGNASAVSGTLADGAPAKAPFDVIFIEGGVERVPEALETQLAEKGRIVTIEVGRGVGKAIRLQKLGGTLVRRDGFQATAPLLAGFAAVRPAFVF